MPKLASRNATVAIIFVGVCIVMFGAALTSPPYVKQPSTLSWFSFVIGLVIIAFGVFRAITKQHEP